MSNKLLPAIALTFITLATFVIFFADGYLQWVNSDTAGEAYGLSQDIRFPQGLFAEEGHRSRITGHLLSYIPFNLAGTIYRELFNDPVNSLYFAQGIMTGTIYVLLIMISAAYISFAAGVLSWRYIFSAFILMLFVMALPSILLLNAPFGIGVRFSHQAVMTNYVGTMTLALFALFPYWRYLCVGKWDDLYGNHYLRVILYFLVIAVMFSSTVTSIWLTIFAGFALMVSLYHRIREIRFNVGPGYLKSLLQIDTKYRPLLLMAILGILAIGLEFFSPRGGETAATFSLSRYLNVLIGFFTASGSTLIFFGPLALGVVACRFYVKSQFSFERSLLLNILPWLITVNLIYIVVVGMPIIPYRFGGHNLGRDTVLMATWSLSLWFVAAMLSFWRDRKLIWFAPLALFILITNALNFFSFPYYGYRAEQKIIFERINAWNSSQPLDTTLRLSWRGLAFSQDACIDHTIPMLKKIGIISPNREVIVVP